MIFHFNPFLHEFFFSSVFERQSKIGSYRLPTHRRGANFLIISSYFKTEILAIRTYTIVTDMQKRAQNLVAEHYERDFYMIFHFNSLLHAFIFRYFLRYSLR